MTIGSLLLTFVYDFTLVVKSVSVLIYTMWIFREAYPDVEVQDVQFAYDIKSLIEFDKER